MVVLPQIFRIPRVTNWNLVRVFDIVDSIMDHLADHVWSFPVWAKDVSALYLAILKHLLEYKASDCETLPLNFGVVLFDFALLCSESIKCIEPLFIDKV